MCMTISIDTSSLLSDIEAFNPGTRKGAVCGVELALNKIDDPDARAVVSDFIDSSIGVSAANVAALLEKHGINIQSPVIRRHRRRITGGDKCTCPLPDAEVSA